MADFKEKFSGVWTKGEISVARVNDAVRRILAEARRQVDAAKVALGERGPPWWTDGARDWNRYLAKNTPYAAWSAALGPDDGD